MTVCFIYSRERDVGAVSSAIVSQVGETPTLSHSEATRITSLLPVVELSNNARQPLVSMVNLVANWGGSPLLFSQMIYSIRDIPPLRAVGGSEIPTDIFCSWSFGSLPSPYSVACAHPGQGRNGSFRLLGGELHG